MSGAANNANPNAIQLENDALKAQLAEFEKRFKALESPSEDKTSAVALYCAYDLMPRTTLTISYDNGKKLVFDKTFQKRTMTTDAFESFASSTQGSNALDKRWIIVGGEVPEHIAEAWGVKYKDGEVYDKKKLSSLLNLPVKELIALYKDLCESHRQTVARKFAQGHIDGDRRVTKDKVTALNSADKDGFLRATLKRMTEKEAASI